MPTVRTIVLDEWAKAMRTGMRLMENLDLPRVHVVQPGRNGLQHFEGVWTFPRDVWQPMEWRLGRPPTRHGLDHP